MPDNIEITYVQRNVASGHSIERLFGAVKMNLPSHFTARTLFPPRRGASPLTLAANSVWLRKQEVKGIVHFTGDTYYLACCFAKRRTVITFHDTVSLRRLRGLKREYVKQFWYRFPSKAATMVTTISEETKRDLVALIGPSLERAIVIPNCYPQNFSQAPRTGNMQRMLVIGTGPLKNVEKIVLASVGLPISLRIIGPLTPNQLTLLQQTGVEYTSASDLSAEDILLEYRECDGVLFPSIFEGFGMPIIEAQAIGRPVLTSNLSPMREVAGDGALLVDPHSVHSIRSGIMSMIANPELTKTLCERGQENCTRFSPRVIAGMYANIYTSLPTA